MNKEIMTTAPIPATQESPRVILPADPFEVMDQMDDKIILEEIKGRIVNTWVYHFKDDSGKEQWGLSKVGVDAACERLAKKGEVIRELEIKYDVDPTNKEFVLFTAKAGRYAVARDGKEVLLDTAIGTKRQGLQIRKRDGGSVPNGFWFEQGATKALRNARSRLIGEEIRSEIVAFAKQSNRVQIIDAEPQRPTNTYSDASPAKPLEGSVSENQTRAIFAIAKSKGMSEEELKSTFNFAHMSELTKQRASEIITSLNKM
jgi:hypothetical protein